MAADFFYHVYRLLLGLVVYPDHHLPQKPHADELDTDNDQEHAQKQKRPAADVPAEKYLSHTQVERYEESGRPAGQPHRAEELKRLCRKALQELHRDQI